MTATPPTPPESEARRPADSSEKAYHAIRQQLVEFQMKPEERINELRLARSLGLSRTPVREALSRLASEGFVTLSPNRGFFVRSLSTEGMLDLYELRAILECAAFRLMCTRASDAELLELQAFWQAFEQTAETQGPDDILRHDESFHLMIAERSQNPEIVAQLTAINARIRFIRRVQIADSALIAAHADIVQAALQRDLESGSTILRNHIEMTVTATQRALKDALLRVYVRDAETATRRAQTKRPTSE